MSDAATLDLTNLANDLQRAAQNADQSVMDVLVSMGDEVASIMREEVPVASGRLRDAIRVKVEGDRVVIGPEGVDYAVYVEYGTEPHDIRPKNAKALKFEINGRTVFATVVHHPGTEPNPFAQRSAQRVLDRIVERVGDKGVEMILGDKRG